MASTHPSSTQETTTEASSLENTPLEFILKEIIPGIAATVDLIAILVGIPLNILFCVAMFKRKRHKEISHAILCHVAIMDIIALLVIVSPGFITACTDAYWVFGAELCVLHGILVTSFFVMTFSYCIWSMAERLLKIVKPSAWTTVFGTCNGKLFPLVVVIQWILAVGYCILPLAGVADIDYQPFGLQCDREYVDSKALTHVHFAICYIFPLLAFSASAAIIAYKRLSQRQSTDIEVSSNYKHFRKVDENKHRTIEVQAEDQVNNNNMYNYVEGSFEKVDEEQTEVKVRNSRDEGSDTDEEKKNAALKVSAPGTSKTETNSTRQRDRGGGGLSRTTSRQRNNTRRKFGFHWDIWENVEDFQLASTLTLSWGTTFGLWGMYVLTAYLLAYQNATFPMWQGVYPLAAMVANLSYFFKPLVYIFHNPAIKLDFKHIIPGKAQKKYKEAQEKYKEYSAKAKHKFSPKHQNKDSNVEHGVSNHVKMTSDDMELTSVKKNGHLPQGEDG